MQYAEGTDVKVRLISDPKLPGTLYVTALIRVNIKYIVYVYIYVHVLILQRRLQEAETCLPADSPRGLNQPPTDTHPQIPVLEI